MAGPPPMRYPAASLSQVGDGWHTKRAERFGAVGLVWWWIRLNEPELGRGRTWWWDPPAYRAKEAGMRKAVLVVVGIVVALFGLLFTLQGVGVLAGSAMSNTTFWSVAGPIIILVGLVVAALGLRPRRH